MMLEKTTLLLQLSLGYHLVYGKEMEIVNYLWEEWFIQKEEQYFEDLPTNFSASQRWCILQKTREE